MGKTFEIVELYREIGNEFRYLGAEKVILIQSRMNPTNRKEMFLEIAVEGLVEKESLLAKGRELWPFVEMEIIVLNEKSERDLVDEIMEDGIVI